MQPEQQKPDTQAYDFILKTDNPVPVPWYRIINKKLLIAILGLLISVIIVAVMAISSINGQKSVQYQNSLLKVAALQTEIIRLSEQGAAQAESTQTKNRANAIGDSLNNSLSEVNAILEDTGKSASEEELSSQQSDEADQTLKKAKVYGNYDKTFEKLIDKMLLEYQRSLLAAEKYANQDEKASLDRAYNEANSMLGLVDQ